MKKLLTFFTLILANSLLGQTYPVPGNTSCVTANGVCGVPTSFDVYFNDSTDTDCRNNPLNLWFYFEISDFQNFLSLFDPDFNDSINSYELYGPIDISQKALYCDSISNSLLSPVLSSYTKALFQNLNLGSVSDGIYLLMIEPEACKSKIRFSLEGDTLHCVELPAPPCEDCISTFSPEPGKKYVLSAWAKEHGAAATKTSYDTPQIYVSFPSLADSVGPFVPSGHIIDGWQRIEGEFTIPIGATDITIRLRATSGNVYFDDIRFFPFDASMKSYVYDPLNMRFAAELDERHYTTFYEYDEEGKLLRIKKETERGIMTIQESRNNSVKKEP